MARDLPIPLPLRTTIPTTPEMAATTTPTTRTMILPRTIPTMAHQMQKTPDFSSSKPSPPSPTAIQVADLEPDNPTLSTAPIRRS
jgi:hypothetical protein